MDDRALTLAQAKRLGMYVDALVNVRDVLAMLREGTRDAVRFADVSEWGRRSAGSEGRRAGDARVRGTRSRGEAEGARGEGVTSLERAAKAAYEEAMASDSRHMVIPRQLLHWEDQPEHIRERVLKMLRTALESLMEPTPEVRAAGRAVDSGAPELEPQGYNAECIWQAMLKKVLE